MSKSSLILLFAAISLLLVSLEFSNNPNGSGADQNALQADIISSKNTHSSAAKLVSTQAVSQVGNEAAVEGSNPSPTGNSTSIVQKVPFTTIMEEVLARNGEDSISIESIYPLHSKLFNTIDLIDFHFIPYENFSLRQGSNLVGEWWIFEAENGDLAQEIYTLIREKSSRELEISVNETNSYGEASFYDNFSSQPESVFLVVKKGRNVYALTYVKGLHDFMKQALLLLP